MQDSLYLYFDGLEHPLQLTGSEHLTEYFPVLFPEWDYRPGEHDDNPVISIRFERGVYHLSTSGEEETKRYTDKADILCALIADLALANSFNDLDALHLHAASVVMNGRLVVFPSQGRAGKSFLTACLVAEGHLYSGDDVFPLALDSCKGRSPGFAPRLRLPLPITTDEKSKRFIESHIAIQGKRYAYLNLGKELRVARNDLLDIGAFVLLERRDGIKAQVEELPATVIFQQLIKQNFAREVEGSLILSTLSKAISQAQCIKICYDRTDDAISLLKETFSCWPSQPKDVENKSYALELQNKNSESIMKDCLMQNEGVLKIKIDGESFLTSPDGQAIYHLDTIGSGIWELLSEPMTKDAVTSILSTAFPEIDKLTIEKDTSKILSSFRLNNLINTSMAHE
ncbi:MAG: PqqD family protein [Sulfuriflexus sp.]|nr:PqqD family protein [Sulfuriflexus sp.]